MFRLQITTASMLMLALAGCDKRSGDGLSKAGQISSITDWPSDHIDVDSLTDAAALLSSLKGIDGGASPVDYTNEASLKRRQLYEKTEKDKILGKGDTLIVLKCAPTGDDEKSLSFNSKDKNLKVRMYTYSEAARENADSIGRLLEDTISTQFKVDMFAVSSKGIGVPIPLDSFQDKNKKLIDDLTEHNFRAAIVKTEDGLNIDISNNPLRRFDLKFKYDISNAQFAALTFISALLNDRRPAIGESQKLLRSSREKWLFYPLNIVPDKTWRASIPFAGDPKNVCLIGRFNEIEKSETKFSNDLSATQTGWYVIDRVSMKIIAAQRIPVEK